MFIDYLVSNVDPVLVVSTWWPCDHSPVMSNHPDIISPDNTSPDWLTWWSKPNGCTIDLLSMFKFTDIFTYCQFITSKIFTDQCIDKFAALMGKCCCVYHGSLVCSHLVKHAITMIHSRYKYWYYSNDNINDVSLAACSMIMNKIELWLTFHLI